MNHLKEIREEMKKRNIDMLVLAQTDDHGSEYVCDHDNAIKWATGFTGYGGLNAMFILTQSEAKLVVDSRYLLYADREIDKNEITVQDIRHLDFEQLFALYSHIYGKSAKYHELINSVWHDRPERPDNAIWIHEPEYASESAEAKLAALRTEMCRQQQREIAIKKLDDISWLLNLKGSDIPYTPVFFAYLYVSMDEAILFAQPGTLNNDVKRYLKDLGVQIQDYSQFESFKQTRFQLLVAKDDLVTHLKTIKSSGEIAHMRESHLRDGACLTKFIYWIKKEIAAGRTIRELEAAQTLDRMRAEDDRFLFPSFETILSYGPNSADVHYSPANGYNSVIGNRGLLFIDSGGHYLDGTTDLTRTISVGELTEQERLDYTLVTVAMLRLLNAKFSAGTPLNELDCIARGFLERYGITYGHATGHGVGYLGCVHEAPLLFDKSVVLPIKPGMVMSNEPGCFRKGSHGVQIENMMVCVENTPAANSSGRGGLCFENLTFAPLDRAAINKAYMTESDVELFNQYQQSVYEKLEGLMNPEERAWLMEETKAI